MFRTNTTIGKGIVVVLFTSIAFIAYLFGSDATSAKSPTCGDFVFASRVGDGAALIDRLSYRVPVPGRTKSRRLTVAIRFDGFRG